jgi:hypothetical protein
MAFRSYTFGSEIHYLTTPTRGVRNRMSIPAQSDCNLLLTILDPGKLRISGGLKFYLVAFERVVSTPTTGCRSEYYRRGYREISQVVSTTKPPATRCLPSLETTTRMHLPRSSVHIIPWAFPLTRSMIVLGRSLCQRSGGATLTNFELPPDRDDHR